MSSLVKLAGLWAVFGVMVAAAPAGAAAPPVEANAFRILIDSRLGGAEPSRPRPTPPTDPADVPARAHCEGSEWWQFVGAFTLRDAGATRLVCLYAQDSDVSAFGGGFYPNHFSLIGVYRDDAGGWNRVEVYSAARTHGGRAVSNSPEVVVVELGGGFILRIDPKWSEEERREWIEVNAKANAPRRRLVRFVSGKLVSEDCPPAEAPYQRR
jgi:hypothetical protein